MVYNELKKGVLIMATDKIRVIALLPPEKYEEFKVLADENGDSMSSVCRRLILEWIEQEKKKKVQS